MYNSTSGSSSTAAGSSIVNWIQQFGSSVISGSHRPIKEEKVRLGNELLLSKVMQKLDSTVVIHGVDMSRFKSHGITRDHVIKLHDGIHSIALTIK